MGLTQILFWLLTAMAIGSALMVITRKNPVHSVLYLIVVFFAISGHYILMNAQVSKTIGKIHPMDFYVGAENLTGFYQHNALIAADQPFSQYFDASMVWGPVTGRMFYAGWRFKLK